MKSYLVDTNILIEVLRKGVHAEMFKEHQIFISVHTHYEMMVGIEKSTSAELKSRKIEAYAALLSLCEVLDYNREHAQVAAEIRADLESRGESIGAIDILIASQALSLSLPLVTKNQREFLRVSALSLTNW